jgi:CRP-like cAMP-binding protein
MSRIDIADYLDLTIETVSRSFSKLRAQGIIDLPHKQTVVVLDVPRLEALARQ